MKLFKTKYDITLNEVSMMFETDNIRILCLKKYIPFYFVAKYYERFMLEFSELFNKEEVNDLFTDDARRFMYIHRAINILPALYNGLLLTGDDRFKKAYQKHFGIEYKDSGQLQMIIDEIKRIQSKIKELGTPLQAVQSKGKMSFESVITYVEMILERGIDRNMKLYQFKHQYDAAIKRAKEWEKLKSNG